MTYSLGQNPVPVWAATEQKPENIVLEEIPPFLLANDAEAAGGQPQKLQPQSPHFLKQTGRWSSMRNFKDDIEDSSTQTTSKVVIDPTILDAYDLNSKWENRMDIQQEKSGGLPSLDSIRAKIVNNLGSNPYFPIFFRGSAAVFSIITLGLACDVLVLTKSYSKDQIDLLDNSSLVGPHGPAAATIYTIVISCLSIVYSLFMLWDETFGQPLGLRPSHTKIKFVFLDLILLCLQSGNVAAAFDALIDRKWICPAVGDIKICKLHQAVISFILVTLVTHFITFLVSAFRMIHRATH